VETDTAVANSTATTATGNATAEESETATIGTNPSGQTVLALTGEVESAFDVSDPEEVGMEIGGSAQVDGEVTADVTSTNAPQGTTTTADLKITVSWVQAGDIPADRFIGFLVRITGPNNETLEVFADGLNDDPVVEITEPGEEETSSQGVDPLNDSVVVQASITDVAIDDPFTIEAIPVNLQETGEPQPDGMGTAILTFDAEVRLRTVAAP